MRRENWTRLFFLCPFLVALSIRQPETVPLCNLWPARLSRETESTSSQPHACVLCDRHGGASFVNVESVPKLPTLPVASNDSSASSVALVIASERFNPISNCFAPTQSNPCEHDWHATKRSDAPLPAECVALGVVTLAHMHAREAAVLLVCERVSIRAYVRACERERVCVCAVDAPSSRHQVPRTETALAWRVGVRVSQWW